MALIGLLYRIDRDYRSYRNVGAPLAGALQALAQSLDNSQTLTPKIARWGCTTIFPDCTMEQLIEFSFPELLTTDEKMCLANLQLSPN